VSVSVYTYPTSSGPAEVCVEQTTPDGTTALYLTRDAARALADQLRRTAGPPPPDARPVGPRHLRLVDRL